MLYIGSRKTNDICVFSGAPVCVLMYRIDWLKVVEWGRGSKKK